MNSESGRGRMITLSALDGAGKTSQLEALVARLRAHGIVPVVTREPGGTPLAEHLREMVIHGQEIDPVTEMMLFFTARHDHMTNVIRPALAAGSWVVSDRFAAAGPIRCADVDIDGGAPVQWPRRHRARQVRASGHRLLRTGAPGLSGAHARAAGALSIGGRLPGASAGHAEPAATP